MTAFYVFHEDNFIMLLQKVCGNLPVSKIANVICKAGSMSLCIVGENSVYTRFFCTEILSRITVDMYAHGYMRF